MSDLATVQALQESNAQLPVSWYFDERIAALEQQLLFDAGPGYVGHGLMVPEIGDYHSLHWAGDSHVLVHTFLAAHNFLYGDKCAMATSVEP